VRIIREVDRPASTTITRKLDSIACRPRGDHREQLARAAID
jgi:hypothetical protein